MPPDLQPGLLPLVPAQQHPACGRVRDQRGCGDVQWDVPPPRVARGRGQGPDPAQVGVLGIAFGLVLVQERGQRGPRGVRFHRTRC